MVQQTLQIATFGEDHGGILAGIRNFPIHKLVLFHYHDDKNEVDEFSRNLRATLDIPISLKVITKPDVIRSAMEHVADIMKKEAQASSSKFS